MPAAQKPQNERERLESLKSYEVLDTIYEKAYDDLVTLASQICNTPMAVVSLIDEDRQWFKAKVGLDETETKREVSFCGHAILKDELMEVPDARNDSRFADNKLVRGRQGIRFYAGNPLTSSDGHRLGTLCVIDKVPRRLTASQKAFLKILSHQVEVLLELRRKTIEISKKENLLAQQQQHLQLLTSTLADFAKPIQKIEGSLDVLIQKNVSSPDFQVKLDDIRHSCDLMADLSTKALEKAKVVEPEKSEEAKKTEEVKVA